MSESPCSLDPGQAGFDLGCAYTLKDGTPVREVFDQPADLVNLVVPNLFVIAGIAIFVLAILGGYKFLAHSQKGLEDAKKIILGGGAGIAIMFAAYWIIQILVRVTGADIPL